MSKRCTHSSESMTIVCKEWISASKTIQEIAADQAIHPIQVNQWERQVLDVARELFTKGKKSKGRDEGQAESGMDSFG